MPQIFQPGANALFRGALFGLPLLTAAVLVLGMTVAQSPWVTGAGMAPPQPVPFSHKLHAGGLGIDCRHCHPSAETAAFAGMPPTRTCMQCHSQIWRDAALLAPVRDSYANDVPIGWVRVADLPDFAWFDHSAHVLKGFGCSTCHGTVEQMAAMESPIAFHMEWCLECHRHPERQVRPRGEVFHGAWSPAGSQIELGTRLVDEYRIRRVTDCSACHR